MHVYRCAYVYACLFVLRYASAPRGHRQGGEGWGSGRGACSLNFEQGGITPPCLEQYNASCPQTAPPCLTLMCPTLPHLEVPMSADRDTPLQ